MIDYAIIVVRTGSTRLPRKCLLPFGEGNVLEHVIKRARHFNFEPIIATTHLAEDDVIEKIAEWNDCKCYRGSINDIEERIEKACKVFNITSFTRIDADDVFFEPNTGQGHRYIGDWHDTAEGYKNCANHIRLTLDYWEDYGLLSIVLAASSWFPSFRTGDEIIELFKRNPDLYKINWFRQQNYEEYQQCESKELDTSV